MLIELKGKIRSVQIKAAIAVNSALIGFYWELGKMISEKENVWGSKLIEQIARDLKEEFPEMKGLSRSNLFYYKQFYVFYKNELVQQVVGQLQNPENQDNSITPKLVTQIPWGHIKLIIGKIKDSKEAQF